MSADRRVAACLLLLLAAIPLLLARLPQHVEVVVGPLAVLLGASVLTLAPLPGWLATAFWLPTALVLLGANAWSAPAASLAMWTLAPLGVLVLGGSARWACATLVPALLSVGVLRGASELVTLRPFAIDHPADILGVLVSIAWAIWHVVEALRFRFARRKLALQRETAEHLEHAIARDLRWLDGVAHLVADPSIKGPVRNPGVGPEQLALAARIDADTILLGWIEGPPLATLSVGWGLCAAARAGLRDPQALLSFGRRRFDEIVEPEAIRWLALWDRRRGELQTAGCTNPGVLSRYMLTAHGPTAIGPRVDIDTYRAVRGMLEEYDATSLVQHTMEVHRAPMVWGMALTGMAMLSAWIPGPGIVWLATVATMIGAHALVTRAAQRCRTLGARAGESLRDRAEAHDDLRFQLARWHGSLLEYHLDIGTEFGATAHRLRGEVLDGGFADMLVDPGGRGRIFSGEIAGRGIAARFLGLAAQVIVRVLLETQARACEPGHVVAQAGQKLRVFGQALRFPVRLRFGMVTCSPRGDCEAWGTLRRLVLTQETVKRTAIVHDARLDPHTRVYLTPASALPGPEDDAPPLAQSEAAERVAQLLRSSAWDHARGSLPSLFSLVFDGVSAPAHGTLIELRHAPREPGEAEATERRSAPGG